MLAICWKSNPSDIELYVQSLQFTSFRGPRNMKSLTDPEQKTFQGSN